MLPGGWHRRSGEPGDDSETPESVDAYGAAGICGKERHMRKRR